MAPLKTLLLGLGNVSRGDDGAGWEVACLFDFLNLPGLETRVAQQLGPEILEEWGNFDRVVFVDAAVDGMETRLEKIEKTQGTPASSTHHLTPQALFSLSRALGAYCPELYLCRIPAESFEFGEPFSAATRRHILQAVRLIRGWLGGVAEPAVQEAQLQQK